MHQLGVCGQRRAVPVRPTPTHTRPHPPAHGHNAAHQCQGPPAQERHTHTATEHTPTTPTELRLLSTTTKQVDTVHVGPCVSAADLHTSPCTRVFSQCGMQCDTVHPTRLHARGTVSGRVCTADPRPVTHAASPAEVHHAAHNRQYIIHTSIITIVKHRWVNSTAGVKRRVPIVWYRTVHTLSESTL